MRIFYLLIPLSFVLHSVSVQAARDGNFVETVLPSSAVSAQAMLGEGYDGSQEKFVGTCVQGTSIFAGAPSASVTFERSLSSSEISDSLGFSVGARARYGMIKASASARFASDSSSNEYSEVTAYSADYHFKNVKFRYNALTDVGVKASQGAGDYVWENWEKTCGHGFVEQIELGAKLLISAKVEFSSKEDKKAFSAEFKISGPAFSASGELRKASRRFGKSASVSIRALQIGGDVSRLSSVFGVGKGSKIDSEGKNLHALLVCSMDHIDACLQVLDSALTYATDTEDERSFPNQIKPNYDPQQPSGPAELAYVVKPWTTLAFYPPPLLIGELVKSARAELSRHFEATLKWRNRVLALASGPFRLSPKQSVKLEEIAQVVDDNISSIMDAALTCYSEAEKCPRTVSHLKTKLKGIDETALNVYPEIFAQWCDSYESGLLKRSAKNTVTALLEVANQELDLDKLPDRCSVAERVLNDFSSFDLRGKGLENIGPLAMFTQLEILSLQENEIKDLSPLKSLHKIRELNLSQNLITDLSPLSDLRSLEKLRVTSNMLTFLPEQVNWPKLRLLWLGDNRISQLASLGGLGALSSLRLHNNRLSDLSALSSLGYLRELDLSSNQIKDFSPLYELKSLRSVRLDQNPANCPPELQDLCEIDL